MLSIQNFPGYYYDADRQVVVSQKKDHTRDLKWYEYKTGTLRVTLYFERKAHYVFSNHIVVDKEAHTCYIDGHATPLVPETTDSFISLQEEFIDFFRSRENKPIRRDALCLKFGRNNVDECAFLFDLEKNDRGTFYHLASRYYA